MINNALIVSAHIQIHTSKRLLLTLVPCGHTWMKSKLMNQSKQELQYDNS